VPGEVITLRDTTNTRVSGELQIGVGNFWEEEYVDESRATKKGLTAGMWLNAQAADAAPQHVRVHPGQELSAADVRLKVLEIQRGTGRDNPSFVKVDVVKTK
jgi:hypothetical protein